MCGAKHECERYITQVPNVSTRSVTTKIDSYFRMRNYSGIEKENSVSTCYPKTIIFIHQVLIIGTRYVPTFFVGIHSTIQHSGVELIAACSIEWNNLQLLIFHSIFDKVHSNSIEWIGKETHVIPSLCIFSNLNLLRKLFLVAKMLHAISGSILISSEFRGIHDNVFLNWFWISDQWTLYGLLTFQLKWAIQRVYTVPTIRL